MAEHTIDCHNLSVGITDRPFRYTAPYGPGTQVILTYNSDDLSALPRPRYSNLGTRWKFNFVQFIEVDAYESQDFLNIGRGYRGGYANDGSGTGTRKSTLTYGRDTLARLNSQHYEHRLTDGTVETYSFAGGMGWNGRERLFLTSIKDRYNHTVNLTWQNVADAGGIAGGTRLTKITDATGKETNLFYENASYPMRITKISDPFGRIVTMQYNASGQLCKLIDPAGVTSEFNYSAESNSGFITSMATPYGTTTFQRGETYNSFNEVNGRYLHITDPTGKQYRLEKRNWMESAEFGSEPLPPGKTSEMRSGCYNALLESGSEQRWAHSRQCACRAVGTRSEHRRIDSRDCEFQGRPD